MCPLSQYLPRGRRWYQGRVAVRSVTWHSVAFEYAIIVCDLRANGAERLAEEMVGGISGHGRCEKRRLTDAPKSSVAYMVVSGHRVRSTIAGVPWQATTKADKGSEQPLTSISDHTAVRSWTKGPAQSDRAEISPPWFYSHPNPGDWARGVNSVGCGVLRTPLTVHKARAGTSRRPGTASHPRVRVPCSALPQWSVRLTPKCAGWMALPRASTRHMGTTSCSNFS